MHDVFIPQSERYGREIPWLLRGLGCFAMERTSWRFNWGELSFRRFGLALGYSVYHEGATVNVMLGWPNIFIKAPMLITQRPGTEDWNASYGVSTFDDSIHFNWRLKFKLVKLPWAWGTAVRWSVFDGNGNKRPVIQEYDKCAGPYADGRHVEKHPFIYVLRSGEIQNRTATIWGEELEWRLYYLPWLPWPRLIRRSIHIDFDAEVGERTGSWKGGTMGCGWEWRNGESMKSCLQRMQHEREFR